MCDSETRQILIEPRGLSEKCTRPFSTHRKIVRVECCVMIAASSGVIILTFCAQHSHQATTGEAEVFAIMI